MRPIEMTKPKRGLARPDWWTAICTGLLALTTMGALWYAHQQIQESRRSSDVQQTQAKNAEQITHLLDLVKTFDQEPMATYRKSLASKRLNTKEADPFELYRILDFFETVGRLIDRGYLNEDDVWNQFGYWVLHLNADAPMRANVDYEQKQNPNEYATYLGLVARLQRIDAEHGSKLSNLTKDDVTNFYREEAQIYGGTPTTHNH
jgi:hypothetical protein